LVRGEARSREDTSERSRRHDLSRMDRESDLAWFRWVSQLSVATCLAFNLPAISAKSSQELNCGDSWLARTHRTGGYWI